ncbi:hypothetical protein BST97_14195 [Nonlabens spongiae]|uniref:Uncharacterized protein n=1 Tax=Nonlabens spongiae TaxID=331648 RepID=A0A1W6MNF0_9FLAO|nr:hypothetical protein BST97_14195 [Nonlabens spongiae]
MGAQLSEQAREQELVFEQVSIAQESSIELSSLFEKALENLGVDVQSIEIHDSGFKISYDTHLQVEDVELALASLLKNEQEDKPFTNLEISFAGEKGNAASGAKALVNKDFYNDQFRNGQLKFYSSEQCPSKFTIDDLDNPDPVSFYKLAVTYSGLCPQIPDSRAGPQSV